VLNPIITTIAVLVLGAKIRLPVLWISRLVVVLLVERSRCRTALAMLDRLVGVPVCVQITGWSAARHNPLVWICGCPNLCTHAHKGE
jgi:hypothetical protein